jgi:hypothetical protein
VTTCLSQASLRWKREKKNKNKNFDDVGGDKSNQRNDLNIKGLKVTLGEIDEVFELFLFFFFFFFFFMSRNTVNKAQMSSDNATSVAWLEEVPPPKINMCFILLSRLSLTTRFYY